MVRKCSLTLALLFVVIVPALTLGASAARAGDRRNEPVRLLTTIPVPVSSANNTAGALYSFDISFVDQKTQTYYLADRSNAAVDVINAKTDTFDRQIQASPPFAGFTGSTATSGPNGVVAAFPWLFVTDAKSRVVSIDLRNDTTVGDVSTNGADNLRADELAYDPRDGVLLVITNADAPPFGTLISVNKTTGQLTVGTRITFDAAHGVDAKAGAEQPVWDPKTGKFYLSIPQIGSNPKDGGVLRIDPITAMVEKTYPVEFCGAAGLTVGPHNDLLVGCNVVFDTAGAVWDPTGTVTAAPKNVILNVKTGATTDVNGVGAGDEVWYNSGDGHYYSTGSGSPLRPLPALTAQGSTPLGVIDADDGTVLQLVPTFNVPAKTTGPLTSQHPAGTSHSVAANAHNNHVFVPLPANNVFPDCLVGCVAVFGVPKKDD